MKYYLHDTNSFDDEKVTELFMKFGYEGLGLFYTLLEKIAKQEKPVKTSVLKSQLKVGKRLEKCWNFMEEIDIISSNNGETFNKQLLNFSEKYQIKKEKTRIKVSEWREKQTDKKDVTSYVPVSNLPKVKESKVKESKGIKKGSEIKISVPSKEDFLDLVIEEFKRLYEESNELPYAVINKGKERAATGKLIAQYKIAHPDHNSNETVEGLSLYFDKVVNINDSWLRANMTLPILMSKFNEVNNILRNGKSTSNKGGSDKEFFSVIKGQLSGR